VWGIYEVWVDEERGGEWDFTTIAYDLTLEGVLAVADERYPGVRLLG
jgi:hypothetical protein